MTSNLARLFPGRSHGILPQVGLIVKEEGREKQSESMTIHVTSLLTVVVTEIDEELHPQGTTVDVWRGSSGRHRISVS